LTPLWHRKLCTFAAGVAYPVDLEGSCDQQEAGGQLLEEDDTLPLEAACQQDEHRPWCDAGPQVGGLLGGPPLQWGLHVVSRVESGCLRCSQLGDLVGSHPIGSPGPQIGCPPVLESPGFGLTCRCGEFVLCENWVRYT